MTAFRENGIFRKTRGYYSLNYYNDNDKNIVKWLKYLINKKLIPEGIVDDRDIRQIKPQDLDGFTQCHFFAGIGGWSYALRLAGWPEDRPVWTGSCPCQPFSVAGKGAGVDDERHLWPAFRWLIAQCRPGVVFGEQVSGKAGREWFDGVSDDLEAINYEVGADDIPACSVGAPHIRQRLWWVADAAGKRQYGAAGMPEQDRRGEPEAGCGVGHAESNGWREKYANFERRYEGIKEKGLMQRPWDYFRIVQCLDGKRRRVPEAESAFPVVADGLPNRVALLRGIGNSIVPQVAAIFIEAYLENQKPSR